MAIQNIETGYKPQFGLGALYHGFNAGNTQRSNEEEILKAVLANQQKQQEMPLDLDIKKLEAAIANAKMNSPTYIPKSLRGYEGQMDSQIAAGDRAIATNPLAVFATNSENQDKGEVAGLNSQIRQAMLGGQGGGLMESFSRSPQEPQGGPLMASMGSGKALPNGYGKGSVWPDGEGLGNNPLIPFGGMRNETAALNTMGQELGPMAGQDPLEDIQTKIREVDRYLADKSIDRATRERLLDLRMALTTEAETRMVGGGNVGEGQPTQTTQMPQGGGSRNLMDLMRAATQTPKHLQAKELAQIRADTSLENTRVRSAAHLAATKERIKNAGIKDPNVQQLIARQIRIMAGEIEGDPVVADMILNRILQDKIATVSAMNKSSMGIQDGQIINKTPPAQDVMAGRRVLDGSYRDRRQREIAAEKGVVGSGTTGGGTKFKVLKTGE